MTSIIDICNQALSIVQTPPIASLEEERREARICNLHYTDCVNYCLEVIKPFFATKRIKPAQSLDYMPQFQYQFAYAKPADFLVMIDDYAQNFPEKWEIEGDYLLTDSNDSPELIYIAKISQVSRWSETFKNAVIFQLAMRIAPELSRSQSVVLFCEQKYQMAESKAKMIDKKQTAPVRNKYISSWEQARYL